MESPSLLCKRSGELLRCDELTEPTAGKGFGRYPHDLSSFFLLINQLAGVQLIGPFPDTFQGGGEELFFSRHVNTFFLLLILEISAIITSKEVKENE